MLKIKPLRSIGLFIKPTQHKSFAEGIINKYALYISNSYGYVPLVFKDGSNRQTSKVPDILNIISNINEQIRILRDRQNQAIGTSNSTAVYLTEVLNNYIYNTTSHYTNYYSKSYPFGDDSENYFNNFQQDGQHDRFVYLMGSRLANRLKTELLDISKQEGVNPLLGGSVSSIHRLIERILSEKKITSREDISYYKALADKYERSQKNILGHVQSQERTISERLDFIWSSMYRYNLLSRLEKLNRTEHEGKLVGNDLLSLKYEGYHNLINDESNIKDGLHESRSSLGLAEKVYLNYNRFKNLFMDNVAETFKTSNNTNVSLEYRKVLQQKDKKERTTDDENSMKSWVHLEEQRNQGQLFTGLRLERLIDKVYTEIERRFKQERQRRGI